MKPSYLIPGDINHDRKVSLQDLVIFARAGLSLNRVSKHLGEAYRANVRPSGKRSP
jgi:hypothetical protein